MNIYCISWVFLIHAVVTGQFMDHAKTPSRPCRSCQTILWLKEIHVSFKSSKKICTCSFSATKKPYLYTVLFKSELTVHCSWFLIPVQIENQEQANIENQVKDWVSRDRKLKIHTAVTQHSMGYSCTNWLYVRNKTNSSFKVNVSSRTSVSSFISSSTVSNPCAKCKQTVYTRVQARR